MLLQSLRRELRMGPLFFSHPSAETMERRAAAAAASEAEASRSSALRIIITLIYTPDSFFFFYRSAANQRPIFHSLTGLFYLLVEIVLVRVVGPEEPRLCSV